MTNTKGFTVFARPSTATSTSPYKMYDPSTRIPSPPNSDDEQSIGSSSNENGAGIETPSGTVVSSTGTTDSSGPSGLPSAASSTTTVSSPPSEPDKPRSRHRIDFSRPQNIFAAESATDNADTTSPSSLWYILTTALLLAFHKEKLIAELWTYLTTSQDNTDDHLLTVARHIREATLKASTLVGFPRAINALLTLHRAIQSSHPSLHTTLQADSSLRSTPWLSRADKFTRGMALFERIYAHHTPRVVATMSSCSGGDLTHFAIQCIYGELLAESAIIGDLETGMLEFVCCLADGVAPQAKGHFFGSVNLGATNGQLRGAVLLAGELARQVGVPCAWLGEGEAADDQQEGKMVDEWKFLKRVM
ncbi:hypothetical protein A1O7_03211 [Cladophialophora yegresii CBS 114405]|uniref:Uncharacterized protein n=1 Tax=Cladophialophora yegresii CBS 114405 TaxID=1182544 RepID=W9W3Z3_9EURO|nr:uncharacterized protein A1O7_03211 [Cladophialophora yegresii CBS 114405]EXJ62772.1 hypothetical protein A1O7_03211 [Cladophialophora yegresii CBS 114405]